MLEKVVAEEAGLVILDAKHGVLLADELVVFIDVGDGNGSTRGGNGGEGLTDEFGAVAVFGFAFTAHDGDA